MTRRADDDGPSAISAQSTEATQSSSFEDALAQLGELVSKIESGTLGLSASIEGYEQGVAILRRLHEELARAEERVSVLVRIDDQGRPVLAPLEPPEQSGDQPQTKRPRPAGRGRPPRSGVLPGMDEAADET